MPKKNPKGAFFFFMLDFKEEQKKKGISYANMNEIMLAADPDWRNAPTSVRMKYEDKAKKAKQRYHAVDTKFTTNGVPLAVIEKQQRDELEAAEMEKQDIRNMIKLKAFNVDNILDENFYLMDVNFYCKHNNEYLIGESTVLRFDLRNGLRDYYHQIINPGEIPCGYAYDVKQGSKELGLDMPDECGDVTNYMMVLANIIDYLKKSDPSVKTLPPLYTMPEKVAAVQDFLLQMCNKAGEDEYLFRVYRLDTMFYNLINAVKTEKDEGLPKESLALLQLKKDQFRYSPGLACEHHQTLDKEVECTSSRSRRWMYTVLDSCCNVLAINPIPGAHLPPDFDVDGIMTCKELRKERAVPTIAGLEIASSSFNSTLNDSSFNSSIVSEKPAKKKVPYVPQRMPTENRSWALRPAPELIDKDFPPLCAGAGRGRGFNKNKK